MKKGLKLLGALVCILAILFIIPSEFHAEKSTIVNGNKADVLVYVKDFNNYRNWNPWFSLDSNMTSKVEGKVYSWESANDMVGSGSQTLVFESEDSIAYELKFTAPMENTAKAYMKFKEVEGGTEVSWGFNSDGNILIGILMDPSTMVGDNYTNGLKLLQDQFKK